MFSNDIKLMNFILAALTVLRKKISKRVKKCLNLSDKTVEIIKSPDKPNSKLSVTKVSYSIESSMFWLIDSLQNLQDKFPRLLIYCTTIKDAAKVYNYVLEELPSCGQFIELYHSQTEDPKKEYIVNELQNSLRILVSTSALGMGIDAKGFNSVVVFGAQNSCSELVQEIGRVGRDHQPSVALILYNSFHQRLLDQEVKKFLGTNGFRRLCLLENFLEEKDVQNT